MTVFFSTKPFTKMCVNIKLYFNLLSNRYRVRLGSIRKYGKYVLELQNKITTKVLQNKLCGRSQQNTI